MTHRPYTASSAELSSDAEEHSTNTEELAAEPEPDVANSSSSSAQSKLPRWITLASLAIGLLALTLTLVQWFYPSSHGGATFSDQQAKDAKTSVCAAYMTVHRAVAINTHLEASTNGDPLAVATSARLALYGGGSYLRDSLAREPATPDDLAKAINSLATTLEDLGISYLAGVPAFAQDQMRHNLDGQLVDVDQRCE